jgi:hypothetical protein
MLSSGTKSNKAAVISILNELQGYVLKAMPSELGKFHHKTVTSFPIAKLHDDKPEACQNAQTPKMVQEPGHSQ